MTATIGKRIAAAAFATALLLLTGIGPARADTQTTRAPYDQDYAAGSTLTARPCEPQALPLPTLNPDAATGSIDISEGLAADDCAYRTAGWSFGWSIPAGDLAGSPAEVIARLKIERVDLIQAVGDARRSARATISIAGRTWRLGAISCRGTTCSTYERASRTYTLRTSVGSLDDRIRVMIEAGASLRNGSGGAGVAVWGRLLSVQIRT